MATPDKGLSQAVVRLWRPAAQRNVRNQWSKLSSYKSQWFACSSTARSHALSLVNAFLSQQYMPSMELGVLKDMPDIKKKACSKLFKQQEIHRRNLLSSYKDMVAVVVNMVNTSRSMRCYIKESSSSQILQFGTSRDDNNDTGDGGGIPVFAFWPVSYFEQLAEELVSMFSFELNLKRLIVTELLGLSCQGPQADELYWSNEIYPGEFDHLSVCNLYSTETCKPVPPRLVEDKHKAPTMQLKSQTNREILQVYLTSWLVEANIDSNRVADIFAIIGEEMHVTLSS